VVHSVVKRRQFWGLLGWLKRGIFGWFLGWFNEAVLDGY